MPTRPKKLPEHKLPPDLRVCNCAGKRPDGDVCNKLLSGEKSVPMLDAMDPADRERMPPLVDTYWLGRPYCGPCAARMGFGKDEEADDADGPEMPEVQPFAEADPAA